MSQPRDLFPRRLEDEQPQEVGDGLADMPITHYSWQIPLNSAWSMNWLFAFLLLVVILIFAILAFGFALGGWLKTTSTHKEINDLSKVCLRSHCIGIHALPISLSGGRCYVLKKNFTLSAGTGISIIGQQDIDLCYANHHITATAPLRVLWIHKSHNIRVHQPTHHAKPRQLTGNAFGIQVGPAPPTSPTLATPDSSSIFIYDPVITDFKDGIVASGSELFISNAHITSGHPGGGGGPNIFGLNLQDMYNVVVKGAYVSLPYDSPAGITDGTTTGLLLQTSVSFSSHTIYPIGRGYIEDVMLDMCAPCLDLHRGTSIETKNVRVRAQPHGIPLNAIQIGSGGPIESLVMTDTVVDCNNTAVPYDCVLVVNARSALIDYMTITGTAHPELASTNAFPNGYRGALLSLGTTDLGGTSSLRFRYESILVNHLTVRALSAETVAVMLNGDLLGDKQNQSYTIMNAVIHGGLAGVLMAPHVRNAMLDNVHVSESKYCFAMTQHANGVVIKNSEAFRCCRGYWADNTSSAIGLYDNKAVRCSTSYLDEGIDDEFGVGFGTEGNNRVLAETISECTLPSVAVPPVAVPILSLQPTNDSTNMMQRRLDWYVGDNLF